MKFEGKISLPKVFMGFLAAVVVTSVLFAGWNNQDSVSREMKK
jgi:hypothetical protein